MSFPDVGFANALDKLEQAMVENGTLFDVHLHTGETFQVKGTMGKLAPDEMTPSMIQQGHRVRILAKHWDAAAGKPPAKGDQITAWTHRSAVESWYRRGLGDTLAMYVLVLKG